MGKEANFLTLDLSGQHLSELPDEFFELNELEALALNANKDIRLSEKLIKLTNLKVLSLAESNLDTVPAVVMKLQQLEALALSNNRNITLPDEMSSLVNLTYLDLDYCNLDTLPSVVLKLLNLQELDLSRNKEIFLPEEFCRLDNMKVLTLTNCDLTTVPPAVLKLHQLEELDLSGNSGIHLPDELAGLTNIRVLNLEKTDMVIVPPVVWKLTQLEWLNLSSNPLQTLPAEVGQLTSVKHLDLSDCQLRTLPPEVWTLTQLEELILRSNPLQTLPAKVGQLTNVKQLDLCFCDLRTLPPKLWRLTQLEWLVLRLNPLQTLPVCIGQLTNVKHLDLWNCQLHTLPPEVGRLTQLEWLDLSYNPLQTLPAEIGQLTNVKHLDLWNCQLHTLPPEVGRLTQLEWLDLRSNPLQKLPAEIEQLTNTKHLDLSNCQLHTLPPEVGRLTQLERLDLSSNPLQALPTAVGQLTNVKHFNLSNCQLHTLSPEVGRLAQLERLDLTSNQLQTLPAEVGQLSIVDDLDVRENPLIKPPAEVCNQGIEAIRQYFEELERSDEKVSARLKVVVLGEKMAGKTSLVQTLGSRVSTLTEEEDRTHCVEITQWAPDDNITFEVYDFGGYDVYHLTHQFFLTPGALNLLTVNLETYRCTEQSYREAVGFWLDTLNARVPGAVVTIVCSKTDLCSHTEIQEKTRDIQERFKQQNDVWQETIQQQITKLENAKVARVGTEQEEVRQQLERTRQLLTRPLRLTGVYCASSAEQTSGIDTLRSHIVESANKTELFPILRIILPQTWVKFERRLRNLRDRGTERGDRRESMALASTSRTLPKDHQSPNHAQDVPKDDELQEHATDRSEHGLSASCAESESDREPLSQSTANNSQDPDEPTKVEPKLQTGYDSDVSTSWYCFDYSDSSDSDLESDKPVWLTRDECLQHGKRAGLIEDRLGPVLSYLQQVGTILRYTDIPELKNLVFHDPSDLIDVIKELFHHNLEEVFTTENPRLKDKGFSEAELTNIRKNLPSLGFLPREVVVALLGPHATPVGNVDVITNLMEHFGLCYAERSDKQDGETSAPTGYCIPWYIGEERPEAIHRDVKQQEETEFTVTCEITHFCPRGLFERLSVVVNKLIKSRQDWKDAVVAVREKLPITVYRESTDEYVKIVITIIVPVQKETHEGWNVIVPLKDELLKLLLEWPGLLYHLVWSEKTLQSEQSGDQKAPTVSKLDLPCPIDQDFICESAIIPTFGVRPEGCTVQHGGATLGFPEGCVDETRFISVEVEAFPVTDDVRTNFTAMSAVLTVEQDFPQRFLRPVTVRLPWVWTQPAAGKETTVILHYSRDQGWTVFQADTHEEDGGVLFQTDHFQGFWVLKVMKNCSKNLVNWCLETWNSYVEDKVYIIVTPEVNILPERTLHLICLQKSDDIHDFFTATNVTLASQIKQRVDLNKDQKIEAVFSTDEDVGTDPRDLREGEVMVLYPATRHTVRLRVKDSAEQKPEYEGKVTFKILDESSEAIEEHGQPFIVLVKLQRPDIQEFPERGFQAPGAVRTSMSYSTESDTTSRFGDTDDEDLLGHHSRDSLSESRPVVLLINNEYGTSMDSNSTINRQTAILLGKHAVVYCTVLSKTKEGIEYAKVDQIKLLFPTQDPDDSEDKEPPSLAWLTKYHQFRFPDLPPDVSCIIGHVDTTDKAAQRIKDSRYPQARVILINHDIPEDTEAYMGPERAMGAGSKERRVVRKAEDTSVMMFSVGQRIYSHFDNQYRLLEDMQPERHQMFLPRPSRTFQDIQVNPPGANTGELVVLSVGEVTAVDKLKGHDIAGRAIGIVGEKIRTVRLRVRGISKADWETSKRILEENLQSGTVKPTLLPYGTQEDIRDDMMTAHLVLMPSRSEPFGLVGLEAIAAGIPVLISDQSGLADLIKQLIRDEKCPADLRHRIVETSVKEANLEEDGRRWAAKILDTLNFIESEFRKAAEFKRDLLASRYWEDSHRLFLRACGITDEHRP
ncbi:MFHAS1 [Branchiostoma lanceolatum]|uniref:Leucine-rich repeat protein SHOC-2 n=1 Tax=Branchiostoma lanceolatum TaxID=7740 RepID=A0A8J9YRT3_BRALA|nr:MFHAS1 [Branchiostoma lanceolatum]